MKKHTIDVIIFQDYDKGVITQELIREVSRLASDNAIPVAVDPKKRNFMNYLGVSLFKPNLKELKEGLNLDSISGTIDTLKSASASLHDHAGHKMIMVTLSEEGIFIHSRNGIDGDEYHHLPAQVRSVSDVSGAGDTVISVASLCLALQVGPRELAELSNLAGGLVCEEVGVVPVNRNRLLEQIIRLKNAE